jgi:murein DD-endopeptidase MepM/ murein hydrolase activator NlpD
MAEWEPTVLIEYYRGEGKPVPIHAKVVDFEYSDSAEETNMVKMTLADVDTTLFDAKDFLDDGKTNVTFRFGYIGNLSRKRDAILSYIRPVFPQSGSITLELKAHDLGLFSQKDKITKVWERNIGYSEDEIAIEIGKSMGLKVVFVPSLNRKLRWTQSNLTDLEFLKELAMSAKPAMGDKKANYAVYIQDDTLYFQPKKLDEKEKFEFTYFPASKKGNLLMFDPQINEKKEDPSTEVRGLGGQGVGEGSNVASEFVARWGISSNYGMRDGKMHRGVDIPCPNGTALNAFYGGEVVYARYGESGSGYGNYGNIVVIRDITNYYHLYAHLETIGVSEGQTVEIGHFIGRTNNTGASKGAHLHYEIRKVGTDPDTHVNPSPFLSSSPTSNAGVDRWRDLAVKYGAQHNIDPSLVLAVIEKESGGNPQATSHAGAMGLMQLMPGTARGLGVTLPYDPAMNVEAGTRYLGQMIAQRNGDVQLALASYNAGGGNVNKAIAKGGNSWTGAKPYLPKETQNYVPKVMAIYNARRGKSVLETGYTYNNGLYRADSYNTGRISLGSSDLITSPYGGTTAQYRTVIDARTGKVTRERSTSNEGLGTVMASKGGYQTNPFSPDGTNMGEEVVTAESIQRANKERTYTARAVVTGNPHIEPNILVKINNVGDRFGGLWWVRSVNHLIGMSAYETELDLQRDALNSDEGAQNGREDGTVEKTKGTESKKDDKVKVDAETGEVTYPEGASNGGEAFDQDRKRRVMEPYLPEQPTSSKDNPLGDILNGGR